MSSPNSSRIPMRAMHESQANFALSLSETFPQNSTISVNSQPEDPYAGLTEKQLKKKEMECIELGRYEEAQTICQTIKQKKLEKTANHVDSCAKALKEGIDAAISAYDEKFFEIEQDFNERREEMQNTAQSVCKATIQSHVDDLSKLELRKQSEMSEIRSKKTPAYVQMIETAKLYAKCDDFQTAKRLNKQAEEEQAAQVRQREEEVQKKFDLITQKVTNKQKVEIQALEKNIDSNLKSLEEEHEKAVAVLNKTIGNIIRTMVQKSVKKSLGDSKNTGEKRVIGQIMNDFAAKVLQKAGKSFLAPIE